MIEAEVEVRKKKIKLNKILLDTGNEYGTIISKRVVKANKLEYRKQNAFATVANGSKLIIFGEADLTLRIGNQTIQVKAKVADISREMNVSYWDIVRHKLKIPGLDYTNISEDPERVYRMNAVEEIASLDF
jgi:hypothetical protein